VVTILLAVPVAYILTSVASTATTELTASYNLAFYQNYYNFTCYPFHERNRLEVHENKAQRTSGPKREEAAITQRKLNRDQLHNSFYKILFSHKMKRVKIRRSMAHAQGK